MMHPMILQQPMVSSKYSPVIVQQDGAGKTKQLTAEARGGGGVDKSPWRHKLYVSGTKDVGEWTMHIAAKTTNSLDHLTKRTKFVNWLKCFVTYKMVRFKYKLQRKTRKFHHFAAVRNAEELF